MLNIKVVRGGEALPPQAFDIYNSGMLFLGCLRLVSEPHYLVAGRSLQVRKLSVFRLSIGSAFETDTGEGSVDSSMIILRSSIPESCIERTREP